MPQESVNRPDNTNALELELLHRDGSPRARAIREAARAPDLPQIADRILRVGELERQYQLDNQDPRSLSDQGCSARVTDAIGRRRARRIEELIRPAVESLREEVFRTTKPPFPTIEAAGNWIKAQAGNWIGPSPDYVASRQQADALLKQLNSLLPYGSVRIDEQFSLSLAYWLKRGRKKDVVYVARETPLGRIRNAVRDLAVMTSLGEHDLVAYILTGQLVIPEAARIRVRPVGMLGTSQPVRRVTIEFDASDVTHATFRRVYSRVRQLLGVSGKKAISEKVRWLLAVVEQSGRPRSIYDKDYWQKIAARSRGRYERWQWRAEAEAYRRHKERRRRVRA